MGMRRPWFTWHMNAYRLIVGAIVLAIVLPASAVGVQAMWLVALASILQRAAVFLTDRVWYYHWAAG